MGSPLLTVTSDLRGRGSGWTEVVVGGGVIFDKWTDKLEVVVGFD